MPTYTCQQCFKDFSQKSHYNKHQKKKIPCQDNKEKIEKVVENMIINKKLISSNSKNIVTNTMEKVQNTNEHELTKLSKQQLLDKCINMGITKCKSKKKSELIMLINNKNKFINSQCVNINKDNPINSTYKYEKNEKNKGNVDNITVNLKNEDILIMNTDCMVELEKLEDSTIDCVITDPPYFIDKLDNQWSANKINNDKKNSHITHLPKGMKFDKSQVKNLYDYYFKLSQLLFKKMKPGAYFLSFSSPRLYHAIAMSCELAGFEIRDMINWTYTQSMPKGMSVTHIIKKMQLPNEEKEKLIKEYSNFKTPQIRSCFEPICVAMKPIGKLTFIKNELNFKTGLLDFSQKVGTSLDRVPANIMITEEFNDIYDKNFMVPKPSKKEKGDNNSHITVKPLALIEHLIKLFSKKGALVVDPFLGSGTTAVACKNSQRKCIGTEINEEYYKICLKRVNPE